MGNIEEIPRFHHQYHVFEDRFEAGKILGSMIKRKYARKNDLLVLAIPSGGIPVGIKISETLGCPFDLLIVRKLQIPGNTEAGFGAMTRDGSVFLNERLVAELQLTPDQIARETRKVESEPERRSRIFRGPVPFPDLAGKPVIIADDGLASGYTMLASIQSVKKAGAKQVIVAIPTAHLRAIEKIKSVVREIYCPNIRESYYFAVADAYKNWHDLNDEEVLGMLGRTGG